MFGLLMLILFIVVWFVANINTNNEVRNRKKQAKEKGQEFYLDRNGTMVDTKTDIPYTIRRMEDGDFWKVNPYSDRRLENISAQKRTKTEAEERAKAIKAGKSIYPFEGYNTHAKDEIVGVRFKDIKTGEIYVKRRFGTHNWLLNIRTCRYDRADDRSLNDTFVISNENGTKYGNHDEALKNLNEIHERRYRHSDDNVMKWRNSCAVVLLPGRFVPELTF